ncbi:tetratricopeptide repeat protein [Flavobacterium luminosum]|uniref:Tetratricopeptide repeat protein n=1 Tax=Flavobacterium luminosum TaxID=2949086 RepID=A0ABT0TKY9_9FLAO|nr:tetratricopeptide repeat protein [Flavobacterium sp. HXWNR70]MCL9808159.1 tetratricopeptide repeat protein [Flavobacterium sp. HXWNR70]
MSRSKLYFGFLFTFFFIKINAQQIVVPNSLNKAKDFEFVIQQENENCKDTLSLQNYLKPLLQKQSNAHASLYNALLANGYKKIQDSITRGSKELYLKSIQQAKVTNNKPLIIWTKLNYVKCLYHFRKYPEMLPTLLQILEDIKEIKRETLIFPGDSYKKIGWIMQTLSDYPEAEHYLQLALKHTNPNSAEYASILDTYGINFYKIRNYKKALEQFNKAGSLALKVKDSLRYAKVLGNKAMVYKDQKDYVKAIVLLKEDITISEWLNDSKNTMFASIALGKIYLENKRFSDAEEILRKAEKIAVSKSYLRKSELEIIKLKLELFKNKPNVPEELVAHRRMLVLEDSLQKADGETQIHLLNWQIQKDKYQEKISQTNKLYKKEVFSKKLYSILAVVLILFAVWIYFYQKNKHKREQIIYEEKVKALELKKAEIELALKSTNNDLNNQVAYIKNKNLEIKKLRSEIESIKASSYYYLEKESGKLKALLDSHLMTDQNWVNFKVQFEKENSDFCQKLSEDFPELTDSNLRIIYLQKLGFSTLETSESLGITPDAVKKAKQRLKKRLGKKYETLFELVQN